MFENKLEQHWHVVIINHNKALLNVSIGTALKRFPEQNFMQINQKSVVNVIALSLGKKLDVPGRNTTSLILWKVNFLRARATLVDRTMYIRQPYCLVQEAINKSYSLI